MKKFVFLALILAACGTPQEQCINRNTRELRVIDGLITETKGNLARGYALVEEVRYRPSFEPCLRPGRPSKDRPHPAPVWTQCHTTVEQTYKRPQAIDLQEEAIKLQQLTERRDILQRQAINVVDYCKATYPEQG